MAGLKELRNRIDAIKSTEKITSAMKMVSAAELRRAEELLDKSAVYRNNLYRAAGVAWQAVCREATENETAPLLPDICRERENGGKYLLVVLASDRGLCGSYNAVIVRTVTARVEELKAAGREVRLICLGSRGYNSLKRRYPDEIIRSAEAASAKGVDYTEAVALADEILQMFYRREADVCEIVYSRFRSAVSRDTQSRQVLPLLPTMLTEALPGEIYNGAFYDGEPDFASQLERLMPLALTEAVYDMMINSQASEQGARMASMDNATRNAKDMISKLTLRYNRLRQSAITTELTEIIAGAEAV